MRFVIYYLVAIVCALAGYFIAGFRRTQKSHICTDRALRQRLSEQQIDKMVEDSFPASDPPSTY